MRRNVDAGLLLDKPAGITSNAALQAAKRLYRAQKAGHAGTLDPLASGLLLVLFGEATKFAGPLLAADKEYVARVRLGVTTSTGDAEGVVLERRDVRLEDALVAATLAKFRGTVSQIPPMYSALKHEGRPLYRLAREGKTVERQPRAVEIQELELLARTADELELRVRCSKGTYVRTLAEDIGAALGVGAHLVALRRTAAGSLQVGNATTLDALEGVDEVERDRRLLPLAQLLGDLPRAELEPAREARFRQGQPVPHPGTPEGLRAVFTANGRFIGLGQASPEGVLRPLRLTAIPPRDAQAAE